LISIKSEPLGETLLSVDVSKKSGAITRDYPNFSAMFKVLKAILDSAILIEYLNSTEIGAVTKTNEILHGMETKDLQEEQNTKDLQETIIRIIVRVI